MRKLILSLLVVASLGACNNEKSEVLPPPTFFSGVSPTPIPETTESEVGRYQYFPNTEHSKKHKMFDTKTGDVYFFDLPFEKAIKLQFDEHRITQDSLYLIINRYPYQSMLGIPRAK